MKFLLSNKLTLLGVLLGGISGFAYWYFIGCASGSCPITSRPMNSIVYGAIMGGLFFNIIQDLTNKNNEPNNQSS
jgi:Family of unknown function (DUF6132)